MSNCNFHYSRESNKRRGSLTIFSKFARPSCTKMSEISINTVERVDEVEQKCLLITCTTKLHRYHFITFPPFITPPFNYLRESLLESSVDHFTCPCENNTIMTFLNAMPGNSC